MSGITWVFFLGWSYRRHQRRPERREELSWIKPAAEQNVMYLNKRLGRSKGRLYIKPAAEQRFMCLQKRLRRSKGRFCIKPAAASSDGALKLKSNKSSSHLFLHMWVLKSRYMQLVCRSIARTKEEVNVFARVCLSICLLARLLKNACMDLDDMLRVDRCRDTDELLNFWARSGL